MGMSLTVIRRENDMIYKEMPGLDIGEEVRLSACGAIRRRRMRWIMFTWMSPDGRRIRDRFCGINAVGGKGEVRDFPAIYDLAGRKVGFDLAKFNAASPVEREC